MSTLRRISGFRRKHNNAAKVLRKTWGIEQLVMESACLRKSHVFLILIALTTAMVVASPGISGFKGGVSDSNQQYGCSTGCHTVQSDSVITMNASATEIEPGATVSVTVTVTGGEASATPLGVLIISALTSSSSLPSDAGWTITSDPSGSTAYNYHEDQSYTGSVTMTWTMTAPTAPGVYTLYAREVHGNGERYKNDYSGGIAFIVGTIQPGELAVYITSPTVGSEVSGTINVAATMVPSDNILYAILSVDGNEVDNKTAPPFTWALDTTQYTDGAHVVKVTAVNSTGVTGEKEIAITVNNAAAGESILSWAWTMAAGALLIIALLSMFVVIALMIRRRVVRGGKVN
jgi:Bacterial Ig domain